MHKIKKLLFFAIPLSFAISFSAEQKKIDLDKPHSRKQAKQLTISPDEIVFGQTGFFTGHFEVYGDQIRHGILSYFKKINDGGGIHGKKLRLISLKDGGRPARALKNVKVMREDLGIDMFLGVMGTRSIFSLLPQIKNQEIAMLFPWAGDDELRKPELANLVNGLGDIKPQIAKLIDHVINDLRITKIGLFHADSSFGITNKNLALQELQAHGIEPVGVVSYNRFTMDLEHPSKKLMESDPKIVLCLSSSTPAAKLIREFFQKGYFGTRFAGIDSTLYVADILELKNVKFSFTSPVPDPEKSKLPIAQEYLDDLYKYYPDEVPNILSFAYYLHAAIIVDALKGITGPVSKEKILARIQEMKQHKVGGFLVDFNPQTRHAYPYDVAIIKG